MKASNRMMVPITHVFALLLFGGMGYLIHYFLLQNPSEIEINHIRFIISGFGVWLAYIGFVRMTTIRNHKSVTNWFKGILSVISFFTAFGLFLNGMVLFMPLTAATDATGEQILALQQRVNFMFKLNLGFLAYTLFCLVFIWPRYVVRKNKIVILKGEVYYPDEKYQMWPFFIYQDEIVKNEMNISPKTILLKCKDTEYFNVNISALIKLKTEEAKIQQIRNLDLTTFVKEVKDWLTKTVVNQARSMTGGELLKGKMKLQELQIAGFPIFWDGNIKITNA